MSKLSDSIGRFLISLKHLPAVIVSLIMTLVATLITQFTSNMATTTIMIPILAQVADQTCVNPIYLMLPVTISASFAFILPVGTPPNAIAYSYGDITIGQMVISSYLFKACVSKRCLLCLNNLSFYSLTKPDESRIGNVFYNERNAHPRDQHLGLHVL